jgi:undecaprenyl-diphosphatase
MDNFAALIYGLVQGATEYLPVSSSAHLAILPHVLGQQDPGLAFDVFLHIGTLLATAVYFFKDWLLILKNPLPKTLPAGTGPVTHLSWLHLFVGTLPAVIAGALLNHWIQENTRSLWVMGITLPLFGVILWWVDRRAPSTKGLKDASVQDLFIIGCVQALSLVPGVSRSGSTMTAARLVGISRTDAARVSFLLSLPITVGAVIYEARHWEEIVASLNGWTPLLIGMASALVFGALAIHFLIKLLGKMSFAIFAVYRVILGAVLLMRG